jgi:Holliday junction resolvase RusA-like endonuclease
MLSESQLAFHVDGTPIAQGSVDTFGTRRVVGVKPALRRWRAAVNLAALAAYGDREPENRPAEIEVIFWLPMPGKPTFGVPAVKPDGDKLLRAVQDALSHVHRKGVTIQRGVVKDDCRFIHGAYWKQYTRGVPGADVFIYWI